MSTAAKPSLLMFCTCDHVHVDPSTGKHFVMGIFSSIKARSFPVTHPRMFWFLVITDVQPGTHRLGLSMGVGENMPTPMAEREFESTSPLQRITLVNQMNNLTFNNPGDYSIQVDVDEEPLLVTTFNVVG